MVSGVYERLAQYVWTLGFRFSIARRSVGRVIMAVRFAVAMPMMVLGPFQTE